MNTPATLTSELSCSATALQLVSSSACTNVADTVARAAEYAAGTLHIQSPRENLSTPSHIAPVVRFRLFFDVPVRSESPCTANAEPTTSSHTFTDKLVLGFGAPLHAITLANLVHAFASCVSRRYPAMTSLYTVRGIRTCHRDTYMSSYARIETSPPVPQRISANSAASPETWYGWYIDRSSCAACTLDKLLVAPLPSLHGPESYDLAVEWEERLTQAPWGSALADRTKETTWQVGFEMMESSVQEEIPSSAWNATDLAAPKVLRAHARVPLPCTSFADSCVAMNVDAPEHSAHDRLSSRCDRSDRRAPGAASSSLSHSFPFLTLCAMADSAKETDTGNDVRTEAHKGESYAARTALCAAESDTRRRLLDAELDDRTLLYAGASDSRMKAAMLVDLTGSSLSNGKIAVLLRRQRGAESRNTRETYRRRSRWSDPAPPADTRVRSLFDTEAFMPRVKRAEEQAAVRSVLNATARLTQEFADRVQCDGPKNLASLQAYGEVGKANALPDVVTQLTPSQRRVPYGAHRSSKPALTQTTRAEAAIEAVLHGLHKRNAGADAMIGASCTTVTTASSTAAISLSPAKLASHATSVQCDTNVTSNMRESRVLAECVHRTGVSARHATPGRVIESEVDKHVHDFVSVGTGCPASTRVDATMESIPRSVYDDTLMYYFEGRHDVTRRERIEFRDMMSIVKRVVNKQRACEEEAVRRAYVDEIAVLAPMDLFDT